MPVINFSDPAQARPYAMLQDDKSDWLKAQEISLLKTKDERNAAIDKLAVETDQDYADEIKSRATTCFANRKEKREASLAKAAADLRSNSPKTPGRKWRPAPKREVAKTNVSKILDTLDQGVRA